MDGHTACTGHFTLLNRTDDVLVHTVAVLARILGRHRTAIGIELVLVVATLSVVCWSRSGRGRRLLS